VNNGCIICIDIGGTNFRIGQVSYHGDVENVQIMPSQFLAEDGDAVETLGRFIMEYAAQNTQYDEVTVSIGLPGLISRDKKRTHSVPNLKNAQGVAVFDNKEVVDVLGAMLGVPVVLNKDVNNLLLFDIFDKDLDGTVVGCYIGTGFGGGVYIHGDILLGKNGVANEIGHIPYYQSQKQCSCGNIGCAECHACGTALKALQEEKYPDTFIGDMFRLHGKDQELIDFVDACSLPIATEINIFDPDHVIIGGGVVEMQDFPKQLLVDDVIFHSRKPYPADNLSILFSRSNKDSGVIGAAIWAMKSKRICMTDSFKENVRGYLCHNNR
jgi:allose kinase